jgi:hypothetical protein
MSSWTRQPQHFFQHLLREVDAIGLDPEALVEELLAMRATGSICMGGGFSAWYPTAVEGQPRNPHLQGDVLGGVVAAAQRRGLRVLARMDISKGRPELAARHPDWFARRPDGSLATVWEMPQICATGPFWTERNPAILHEVLARYPVDGFFYNYLHVPRCWCDRCRRLVRDATGEDVPPPGTRRPAHERWRRQVLAAAVRGMRDLIAARRPAAVLVPYHHVRDGWDMRAMAEASGMVSSQISNPELPNPVDPQPIWTHWAAEEALLARAVKPGVAPLLVQTASGFFASRQTAIPDGRMIRNMAQAMAHGAGTCPAINGRLPGEDPRAAPAMAAFGRYRAATAQAYRDVASLARIALIRSEDSIAWGADAGRAAGDPAGQGHLAEQRGLYEMLAELRQPCDILPDRGLTAAGLQGYALVVLPDVTCLSAADAAALDAYVAAGGALLATGAPGACDEDGQPRTAPALRCLPALPGAPRDVTGAYFALAAPALRAAFGAAPHLGAAGAFWSPELPDADVELRLIGPFANNAPEFTAVAGPGTTPGLLARRHGAGRASWLPWRPGALFHRHGLLDYRRLLGRLVEDAAGPPPVVTDAPAVVEVVLVGTPRGRLLHLVNGAAPQGRSMSEVASLAGFTLRLRGAGSASRLDDGPLSAAREGDELVLRLDRLDGFAAIALPDAPAGTNGDSR